MKCIKCGTEFFEGVFCPECGTKYDEDEAKIAEKKEEEKVKLEEEELVKVQEDNETRKCVNSFRYYRRKRGINFRDT